MGPTEKFLSPTISTYPTTMNSHQNQSTFSPELLPEDWGIVRKLKLTSETLEKQTALLRSIVEATQTLSRLHLPSELVHYRKIWVEGSMSERFSAALSLPTLTTMESSSGERDIDNPTFLCLLMERVNQVTLKDWLIDRAGSFLYESQITCIVIQLLSGLKFILENNIKSMSELSCSNILVVQEEPFASELSPKLKIDCLSPDKLSVLLDSESSNDTNSTDNELKNAFEFVNGLYSQLLQNNLCTTVTDINEVQKTVELTYPEEFKIIEELSQEKMAVSVITSILTKLETLKQKHSSGLILNISEPSRSFVGRSEEMNKLKEVLTGSGESDLKNNLIVLHGPSGAGKSEMIRQLSRTLLCRHDGADTGNLNILCFQASSVDSLTRSVCACASHSKLQLPIKDHLENPKLLKDIFQSVLLADENTLLIFDNADSPSEEMIDLINVFKEQTKRDQSSSLKSKQYLILVMKEIWTNSSILTESTMVSLDKLSSSDSTALLRNNLQLEGESEEIQEAAEILQHLPAALQMAITFAKNVPLLTFKDIAEALNKLIEGYPKLKDTSDSHPYQGTHLIYSLSFKFCLESLNEADKLLADKVLKFLQHCDGENGITLYVLHEIVQNFPEPKPTMEELKKVIKAISNFSLISFVDGVIRLSAWRQQALKASISKLLEEANQPSTDNCDRGSELLSAIKNTLCATQAQSNFKIIDVLPHAIKTWLALAGSNPTLAKQFETMPELISKLAKDFDKFEEVTGFVKQAGDILALAHNNPYHVQILKLKYSLGVESLLPKSRINEAFLIFKTIQEQSQTEPREFLMLKLKSLIQLGKIHITRQEYEKAISCFQQVQIFAVQKIATIALDSEPTVLNARMMHGYVHFLQSNLGEGKKILLQVIPLLERYEGPELDQVRKYLLQAKFYLACLLRQSGDLINALMLHTKVLEERERLFGKKHPNTWPSKLEMALLYSSYDNHDKALLLLRQLLEIQEDVLGAPSNTQSLATMNAIAEIELKLGNFDDALELYEAIDLIEQEVLQDQDEMRISTQLNQAEVLMSLGQYKEAVDIFDLVYALRSTSDDKSSKNAKLLEEISNKKEKAGRSMEILGNYWLSLTPENVDDPSELAALAKKHEVAMELTENQDNHGALRFLREVLEDSTHLEDTNRFLLNIKGDLARVLGLVGKFNESFSVYKEIIPLLDATFGETDELTMLCKDTMGQVFLFSGNQFLKRQMSNLKWFLF